MTHPLTITADGRPTLIVDNPAFQVRVADHVADQVADTWRALRTVADQHNLLCFGERGDGFTFINFRHHGVRWVVSGDRAELGRIRATAAALAGWLATGAAGPIMEASHVAR